MKLTRTLLASTAMATCFAAAAQEADIRKVLAERIPQMEKIDEVRPTPMKGLYEVRIGTDLFYTDAKGDYVIQGESKIEVSWVTEWELDELTEFRAWYYGKGGVALNPKPSDLTDAEWKHGSSDGILFVVVRDGVPKTGMRGYASRMTTNDIWHIVNYVRTLAPKPSSAH